MESCFVPLADATARVPPNGSRRSSVAVAGGIATRYSVSTRGNMDGHPSPPVIDQLGYGFARGFRFGFGAGFDMRSRYRYR
jgi:hypothetical protein